MGVSRWGEGTDQSASIGTSRGDPSIYVDPERFARERDRLFRRTWHVAGRSEELPEPGDFLVWERIGQSVVIARQSDGGLAAFHNVCRHRGARIVREGGHCEVGKLVCPFHSFVYDLEGRVIGIPERETFDSDQLAGLRAEPVAVEVWEGWIWVHFERDAAPSLEAYLGELGDEIAWYGMGDWKYYGSSSWLAEANWKVVLEGFLESWHTPTVHRRSAPRGFDVARSTFATFDPHSMMVVPLSALDIDSAPRPVEHRQFADCQYLIFPAAFLNMFPDQGYLITVYPIDENRTFCQGYVVARKTPPEGVEYATWNASIESSRGVMDRIMREDLEISAEIGATKHSYANEGNLYNTLECRITAFHQQIERYLAD
jgi:nitrite reductase/ring-hydroxylating ferredoxin subunit